MFDHYVVVIFFMFLFYPYSTPDGVVIYYG